MDHEPTGLMPTPTHTINTGLSAAGRDYLRTILVFLARPRVAVAFAVAALVAGAALNWSWLAAAGIAPLLVTALPCLAMCGLGLCMSKMQGQACAGKETSQDTSTPAS